MPQPTDSLRERALEALGRLGGYGTRDAAVRDKALIRRAIEALPTEEELASLNRMGGNYHTEADATSILVWLCRLAGQQEEEPKP